MAIENDDDVAGMQMEIEFKWESVQKGFSFVNGAVECENTFI